ncbi:MAG: hypothetical protein AAB795_02715, partial [Patescibacteria group bacterium]
MVDTNLVKYIKDSFAAGHQRQDIMTALLAAGWEQSMVDDGFAEVQKVQTQPQPSPQLFPKPSPQPASQPTTKPTAQQTQQPIQQNIVVSSNIGGITIKTKRNYLRALVIIILVVVVMAAIGGVAYSYFMKIGPFAKAPYTVDNLVQGLLGAASRIDTSSYLVSGFASVGARDGDAKPFISNLADDKDFIKRYQNDLKRSRDINSILSSLKLYNSNQGKFPQSLKLIARYYTVSLLDSANPPYVYMIMDGGKNFSLTVIFETDVAITQLKQSYKYTASTTPIDRNKVTFTKGSYSIYLPSTPPKPFLAELGDMTNYLPAEMKAGLSASATTDWKKENADWKFNINATGDFGDLTYKVDLDALRKNNIYYFKINNLPSLFLSSFATIKGDWIKIDAKTASSSSNDYYNEFSWVASQLPDVEKSYKEQRQEFADILKKAAAIADEEHLFALKNEQQSERVDGRLLYRYDIKINKNAIVSFYKRLINETFVSKLNIFAIADVGYIEYLQSSAFNETFDYYDKNTSLTFWVDPQGFPAIVSYNIRVVPSDLATQLKDKQINFVFKLVLSDINKPVVIEEP